MRHDVRPSTTRAAQELHPLHPGTHIELKPKLAMRPGALLLICAWSLPSKLVAGECDEVEPVPPVLVIPASACNTLGSIPS